MLFAAGGLLHGSGAPCLSDGADCGVKKVVDVDADAPAADKGVTADHSSDAAVLEAADTSPGAGILEAPDAES